MNDTSALAILGVFLIGVIAIFCFVVWLFYWSFRLFFGIGIVQRIQIFFLLFVLKIFRVVYRWISFYRRWLTKSIKVGSIKG